MENKHSLTTENKMFTKTEIISRGWTETLINKFAPAPDLVKPNFQYKKSVIKLYLQDSILAIEKTREFIQAFEIATKNKQRGSKAMQTRKVNEKGEMKKIDYSTFDFPKLSQNELYTEAVKHYNQVHYDCATVNEHPEFLNRIAKNYLRHVVIEDYECRLSELKGKLTKEEFYITLRNNIDNAIGVAYPFLN